MQASVLGAKKLFDQAPLELTALGRALFGKKQFLRILQVGGEFPDPESSSFLVQKGLSLEALFRLRRI